MSCAATARSTSPARGRSRSGSSPSGSNCNRRCRRAREPKSKKRFFDGRHQSGVSMAKRYYEKDGNLRHLEGKTIAVIGYGSQGHAHSLNLRDSGVNVVVGLYPGSKSWAKAEAAGLRVMTTADAAKTADMVMILVSDHIQADLYHKEIAPHMTTGKTLMFAHGFNIHFQQIAPPPGVD